LKNGIKKMESVSLQRPVEKYLPTATVKKLEFDLLHELPPEIGDEIRRSRFFSENDAAGILDAIAEKCKLSKAPEENIVFDLVVIGIIPTELGAILSANLALWDDIRMLKYLHPRKASSLIFPIEFERV
jgi:hypothetical protein